MAVLTATIMKNRVALGLAISRGTLALPSGVRFSKEFSVSFIADEDDTDDGGSEVIIGDDLEPVLSMSRKFYATTDDAKHVHMSEQTVSKLIAACGGEDGVLLIAEHESAPVGFFAGLIVPGMFNAGFHALHEVAWYVEPEFNGMGYGKKLIKAADDIRKVLGCWKFEKATLATSPKYADDILIAAGFAPSYKSFMKVD